MNQPLPGRRILITGGLDVLVHAATKGAGPGLGAFCGQGVGG